MSSVDENLSKSLDNENRSLITDKLPDVRKWVNIRFGHRQSVTKTLKMISLKRELRITKKD